MTVDGAEWGQQESPRMFKVGDKVEWVSSNTRKVGRVVRVVPAGQRPTEVKTPGRRRDHETYVIEGRRVGGGEYGRFELYGSRSLYWPRVSLLKAYTGKLVA